MTDAVIIRRATVSDAARISELEARYIDCPWNEAQVRAEINKPDVLFFTAEINGEVVGYLSGECAADECEVSNIAVDEPYRRHKIGCKLFAALLDCAARRGIQRVFLLVKSTNAAAVGLYEKTGFKSVGSRRGYYRDGDAVVMRLDL